jgi:hypothetical protein
VGKSDDKFKRAIERSEPVREAMRKHDCLFVWGLEAAPDIRVEAFSKLGLRSVILLLFPDGGFTTFIPADPDSNRIEGDVAALETYFTDAEKKVGIRDIDKPNPGLRAIARRFPSLMSKVDAIPLKPNPYNDHAQIADSLRAAYDPETGKQNAGWVTGGGRCAIAFCLNIWSVSSPFNLAVAMNTWDSGHKAAFKAWIADGSPTF